MQHHRRDIGGAGGKAQPRQQTAAAGIGGFVRAVGHRLPFLS
jgi:hypothetical protein